MHNAGEENGWNENTKWSGTGKNSRGMRKLIEDGGTGGRRETVETVVEAIIKAENCAFKDMKMGAFLLGLS